MNLKLICEKKIVVLTLLIEIWTSFNQKRPNRSRLAYFLINSGKLLLLKTTLVSLCCLKFCCWQKDASSRLCECWMTGSRRLPLPAWQEAKGTINQPVNHRRGKKQSWIWQKKFFLSLYVKIVQLEILITRSERWKKISQCFGSWLFPEPDRIFWPEFRSGLAENPDPDHWKNSWNCNYKYIFVYIIFGTLNIVLFVQVPPKPYQKTSFRSQSFVNGGIRVFKERIRIGEKTRIHPDPEHWN